MNFWQNSKNLLCRIPGWCFGFVLGCIFLLIGFFANQYTDILKKAVMICLECIGIG